MSNLSVGDILIVIFSLLLVFAAAIYSAFRSKSNKNQADEYFLAGRSMPWFFITASLFASNIGAEHFVGQAGAAAKNGLSFSLYDWTAGYLLLALGWIFAPVYLKAKLTTVPEYLERRFNKQCRLVYVLMTMVVYVVAKIGATLYAGSIILDVIAGMNIWESTPLIIIVTASYTITGGLTAVMLTDTIQMLIFVFGGLMGTGFALHLVGGLSGMFDKLSREDIGLESFRHVLQPASDSIVPWPGTLFGIPVVSIWYWCIDQEMVQRVLSARSLQHARMGAASAGLFKVLPPFITVIPGMAARTLFELCNADPTKSTFPEWCMPLLDHSKEADKAYPLLVLREFPNGIKGIMVASFLAAMMSSLSSVYNSACTIFTYDVYERFFVTGGPSPPEKLVVVGRYVTIALTILTFCWLPVVEAANRGLYVVGQEAMTHLVPAASALFVCGIFIPFTNGNGGLSGFVFGICFGITRYMLYYGFQSYCDDRVDENDAQHFNSFNWIVCLNYNYFAIILFLLTIGVICAVSWVTERPRPSQLEGLLSDLVARPISNEQKEIQMKNYQYEPVDDESQTTAHPENVASPSSHTEEFKYMQSPFQEISSDSPWHRIQTFFDVEVGFAAPLFTFIAIIVLTTLIAVYH